jgi:hypothetical protein
MGSECTAPLLCIRWMEVTGQLDVSVASLNRKPVGPQSLSGPFGEWRSVLFLPGIEQQFLGRPAYNSVVTVPIVLCLLHCVQCCCLHLKLVRMFLRVSIS